MRRSSAEIAIIDRAADSSGRSRTDFVRDAAMREAEAVLTEKSLLRMTRGGFAAFLAAIAAPDTRFRGWSNSSDAPWKSIAEKSRAMARSTPEPLNRQHDTARFSFGKPALDHRFKTRAIEPALSLAAQKGRAAGIPGGVEFPGVGAGRFGRARRTRGSNRCGALAARQPI